NSRFLGTHAEVGSFTAMAAMANTNQTVNLSLNSDMLAAINSGADFSIYLVTDHFAGTTQTQRLTIYSQEGIPSVTGFSGTAAPATLIANFQAVPEPTTIAAIGLGLIAVVRRRRK